MTNIGKKPLTWRYKKYEKEPTLLIQFAKSYYDDYEQLEGLLTKDGKGALLFSYSCLEESLLKLDNLLDVSENTDKKGLTERHLTDTLVAHEIIWSSRVESQASKISDIKERISRIQKKQQDVLGCHYDSFQYVRSNSQRDLTIEDISELFLLISNNGKLISDDWNNKYDLENKTGYRQDKVRIGRALGFPISRILPSLEALVTFFNEDNIDNPHLKALIIHYYFEVIHPFPDFNGRIGRLLVHWYYNHINSTDKIYFSLICKSNQILYYHAFDRAYRQGGGDLTYFLHTLIKMYILQKTAYIHLNIIRKVLLGRDKVLLTEHECNILMFFLSKEEASSFSYKTKDIFELFLGENEVTIRGWIDHLVKLDLLEKIGGQKENVYILSEKVNKILETR